MSVLPQIIVIYSPSGVNITDQGLYSLSLLFFADMAEKWLAKVKETKKPSTYVKYRLIYKNHLKLLFQEAAIREITDCRVQEKISDPLSESVQKSIYCVLNQILKFASQNYSITMPFLKRPVSHAPKNQLKHSPGRNRQNCFPNYIKIVV